MGREECPITLEPLATLPYPPFIIKGASSSNSASYFDGLALASYIVSRGIFQNPLTREDLTWEDCRRLDDYLDEHNCWLTSSSAVGSEILTGNSQRILSVEESFRLHQSVRVEQHDRSGEIGHLQRQQEQQRAEALRNTATAALAGLFVYGNDRRSQRSRRWRQQQGDSSASMTESTVSRSDNDILYDHEQHLEWGFDLYRQVEDSAEYATEGWTVIDDDEAMVVATERQRYQAAQNAFPPLHDNSASTSATGTPHDVQVDARFVRTVHDIAEKEELQASRDAHRREIARQQLLREALQRREERKREWKQRLAEEKEKLKEQKRESKEMDAIQQEIEAWREEQWEALRKQSERRLEEVKRQRQQLEQQKILAKEEDLNLGGNDTTLNDTNDNVTPEINTEDKIAAQKKAKAAAKRKRAKERKKAQKAQEKEVEAQKKKEMELESRRAASGVKCAACGNGVLGCGFEKYNKKYCSPKCARTATK